MKIAYADPPYPGNAHMYGRREVDHVRLIAALSRFDGWALSTSPSGVRDLWHVCPEKTRMAPWCKTWNAGQHMYPYFCWEGVLFKSARTFTIGNAERPENRRIRLKRGFYRDWLRCAPSMNGFKGAKPFEFCGWLFDLLGCEPEDEFHDLFYGSGAVTRAWEQWCRYKRAGGPLFVREIVREP